MKNTLIQNNRPRPIFVLGSPRSGTTMMGKYISSSANITNLGEYAGFDFTHRLAVKELSGMPSAYVKKYLSELIHHAREFADNISRQEGTEYFCDSAPWNLLSVKSIAERESDALFILCIRDVRGVIQSLEKSYNQGFEWCGADFNARLQVWLDFYSQAQSIPLNRLVIFNYDNFCDKPEEEILKLNASFKTTGLNGEIFDRTVFTKSHATKIEDSRSVVASISENGNLVFQKQSSWDSDLWSTKNEYFLSENVNYQKVFDFISNLSTHDLLRSTAPKYNP